MDQARHHDAAAGLAQRRREHGQRAGQHPAVGVEHQHRVQAGQVQCGDTRVHRGGVTRVAPEFDDLHGKVGEVLGDVTRLVSGRVVGHDHRGQRRPLLGQRAKAVTEDVSAVVGHDHRRHPGVAGHACIFAAGHDHPRRRLTARTALPRARWVRGRVGVEHPGDPGGVHVVPQAGPGLQPGVRPGASAVAGVRASHPGRPQPAQHVPVIGAERDRHPRHGATGELTEHLVSVVQLLPRLRVVDPPPVPVRPAVRPDRHAGVQQRADAGTVDPSAISQHAGEQEELRGEAALHESGQRDLHIGRVSVVESDPDVGPLRHRVEHPLELCDAHPGLVLARVEFAAGGTDPMDRDVDYRARPDGVAER